MSDISFFEALEDENETAIVSLKNIDIFLAHLEAFQRFATYDRILLWKEEFERCKTKEYEVEWDEPDIDTYNVWEYKSSTETRQDSEWI